jgi:hypothetical protein
MRIVEVYSFNNGGPFIEKNFPSELSEIKCAINAVDATLTRTKVSKEKNREGQLLFSPVDLNKALLDNQLYNQGWVKKRVTYKISIPGRKRPYRGYIECDGLKNGLGLEVQFGKYAFLGWDVLGKMPIFAQQAYFIAGVEIVPMASFRGGQQMSSGIGCFEQIKEILKLRGVSNLDIPVLILGIAPDEVEAGKAVLVEEELPFQEQ